jgi:hypothetical protein
MYQHIGVAMPQQAHAVFNLNAAKPQVAPLNKAVDIVAQTYSDIHIKNALRVNEQ